LSAISSIELPQRASVNKNGGASPTLHGYRRYNVNVLVWFEPCGKRNIRRFPCRAHFVSVLLSVNSLVRGFSSKRSGEAPKPSIAAKQNHI
jgi:hypothetical protein